VKEFDMTCEAQGPKTPGYGTECDPAVRNRYFRGKLLAVADYKAEQRYLIQRRRMVNRAVLGWGVISGFNVTVANHKIGISDGVAFDNCGREVVACEAVSLEKSADVVWLTPSDPPKMDGKPAAGLYLLSAHYAECLIDGVKIEEGCGQSAYEWNHVRETVVYSLRPFEQCPCGRPGCHKPHYKESDCEVVEQVELPSRLPNDKDEIHFVGPDDRGPYATLCEWSRDRFKGEDPFDPCAKSELCSKDCISFNPCAGVPLACVRVGIDDCGQPTFDELKDKELEDECDPRRLVHPNDSLYDLIRGCDLTRIASIGWKEPRTMSRDDFSRYFRPRAKRQPVDTAFSICFTQPVWVASLTTDVITITLVQTDQRERLGEVHRVPIEALWIAPTQRGDPEGTTRGFRPMVAWQFWDGEIDPDAKSGFERPTLVEIEVRGDFILDWRGQTVDANRFGRRFPTGNGTPGGTFLSTFTVTDEPPRAVQAVGDQRTA
jgi:hypothetical protein